MEIKGNNLQELSLSAISNEFINSNIPNKEIQISNLQFPKFEKGFKPQNSIKPYFFPKSKFHLKRIHSEEIIRRLEKKKSELLSRIQEIENMSQSLITEQQSKRVLKSQNWESLEVRKNKEKEVKKFLHTRQQKDQEIREKLQNFVEREKERKIEIENSALMKNELKRAQNHKNLIEKSRIRIKEIEEKQKSRETRNKEFIDFYIQWKRKIPLFKRLEKNFEVSEENFRHQKTEKATKKLKEIMKSVGKEEIEVHKKKYFEAKRKIKSENNSFVKHFPTDSAHLYKSHFHQEIRCKTKISDSHKENRRKMERFSRQVKEIIFPKMVISHIPIPKPKTCLPRLSSDARKMGNENLRELRNYRRRSISLQKDSSEAKSFLNEEFEAFKRKRNLGKGYLRTLRLITNQNGTDPGFGISKSLLLYHADGLNEKSQMMEIQENNILPNFRVNKSASVDLLIKSIQTKLLLL